MDNCSKFFKNPPGILTNEEGQGAKHHPFVRVLGIVLILSAVVSLASWGGSPTISGAHASNFHPPHLLDVESHRSRHNAVVHALPQQYVAHGPISINKNADFDEFCTAEYWCKANGTSDFDCEITERVAELSVNINLLSPIYVGVILIMLTIKKKQRLGSYLSQKIPADTQLR